MTRAKNLDTVFNRYRRIANPYKEKLDQGKRLYSQLESFRISSPEQWEDYKIIEEKYNEVREECNTLARQLNEISEELNHM